MGTQNQAHAMMRQKSIGQPALSERQRLVGATRHGLRVALRSDP